MQVETSQENSIGIVKDDGFWLIDIEQLIKASQLYASLCVLYDHILLQRACFKYKSELSMMIDDIYNLIAIYNCKIGARYIVMKLGLYLFYLSIGLELDLMT